MTKQLIQEFLLFIFLSCCLFASEDSELDAHLLNDLRESDISVPSNAVCPRYDVISEILDEQDLSPYKQAIEIARIRLNCFQTTIQFLTQPNIPLDAKTNFCTTQDWTLKGFLEKPIPEIMKKLDIFKEDILNVWELNNLDGIAPKLVIISSFLKRCELTILQWRYFHQSLLNLQGCEVQDSGVQHLFKEAHILSWFSDKEYSRKRTRYTHDQIFFSRCLLDCLAFHLYEKGLLTGIEQDVAGIFIYEPICTLPWGNKKGNNNPSDCSEVREVYNLIDLITYSQKIHPPEEPKVTPLPTEIRSILMDYVSNFYAPNSQQGLGQWFTQCILDQTLVASIRSHLRDIDEAKYDLHEEEPGEEPEEKPVDELEEEAPVIDNLSEPVIEQIPNPAFNVFLNKDSNLAPSHESLAEEQLNEDDVTTTEELYDEEDVNEAVKRDFYEEHSPTSHIARLDRYPWKKDPEKIRFKQNLCYFLTPENCGYLKRKEWIEYLKSNTDWVTVCQDTVEAVVAEIHVRLKREDLRFLQAKASFLPKHLQSKSSHTNRSKKVANGRTENGRKMNVKTENGRVIAAVSAKQSPPVSTEQEQSANIEIKFATHVLPIFRELKPSENEIQMYKALLNTETESPLTWAELMSSLVAFEWTIKEIGNSFCLLSPPEWLATVECSGEDAAPLRHTCFMLPYPQESLNRPLTRECLEFLKLTFQRDLGLSNLMLAVLHAAINNALL